MANCGKCSRFSPPKRRIASDVRRPHIATMSNVLPILVIVALVATLGALALGLFSMVRGGEFNTKHSNKFMRARVFLQLGAVALLGLLFLFSKK